ncbi:MAG: Arc family DNA-binding protein [Rhodobacteraceae bacterium]|nr:Arc family DNA-binding protein [Paracoccaceae bacterium]
MASITIRNLDDEVKRRLRMRAAANGRSMEEEVRQILRAALGDADPPFNLAAAIRSRVAAVSGADLDLPQHDPMRPPPEFDWD